MPLSIAAKAALCACPPAVMVGAVATVPAVKRAAHHATAPRTAHKPVKRVAARPAKTAAPRSVDCVPAGAGALPAVPLVTYAAPIPEDPAGEGSVGTSSVGGGGVAVGGGGVPLIGAIGVGSGGGGGATPATPTTPVTPTTPTPTPTPGADAVPEPSVWLMMITGVGALGAALRRRRQPRVSAAGGRGYRLAGGASAGGALWSSAAVEAGDVASFAAVKSTVAGVAGKALLCVCPAAVVAGSVMTVPPLRQAVHAATVVPTVPAPVALGTPVAPPCVESVTVPVEASSLNGLPRSVQTIPVTAAVPATAPAPVPPSA